jgi:hypothetical protein
MFAKHQAGSLITGEIVPSELYLQEFATENFVGLIEAVPLAAAFGREFPSNKIFANTFLFSEDDLLLTKGLSGPEIIDNCVGRHREQANAILRSQFVAPDSLQFLREGDLGSFLTTRASLIVRQATRMVDPDS